MEKSFDKYRGKGSVHWQEMWSRDPRRFNAYQQGRYELVMAMAGDVTTKKVLDVGAGDGCISYLLTRAGAEVTGIDNESEGVELAKQNLASRGQLPGTCKFVIGTGYELPFEENAFDMVVCSEVIEHVEQPERLARELQRVVRPGGRVIITTPHRQTEVPFDHNHVHEFFPGELASILKPVFARVEIELTHHAFWTGLYNYSLRWFSDRQVGRWCINLLAFAGYNPFTIRFPKPKKFDVFTQIMAICTK